MQNLTVLGAGDYIIKTVGEQYGKDLNQRHCIVMPFENKPELLREAMLYEEKNLIKDDNMLTRIQYNTKEVQERMQYNSKEAQESMQYNTKGTPERIQYKEVQETMQYTNKEVPERIHYKDLQEKNKIQPKNGLMPQNVSYDSKAVTDQNLPEGQYDVLRNLLTKEKVKRDRKVLHPQAKELILNVVNFMKQEANGEFVVPARKVQCRAAMATGFSERTVRRVVKESKSLPASEATNGESSSISFPPKKIANRPKPKTGLDSLTRCAVRKIIHRIYVNDKAVPTIKKIHQKLVDEIGFKGGSRSAHKIVKELGFFWKKTKTRSFVLMERHDIRLKRIEYLRDMTRLRHEGRPIVYVGEAILSCGRNGECVTALTAGSERGFVPGSLFALDGQTDLAPHASGWVREALIPALPPCTVVVLDGAAFNSSHERIPTLDCDTETMKRWLTGKGISFRSDMLRPELHQVIRRSAGRIRKHKSAVEQLLTEAGHTVLRIPPDHPDVNPAALIWAEVRRSLGERSGGVAADTRALAERRLSELGPDTWSARCAHVRFVEQQYLASEGIVDAEVERVLAAGKDVGCAPEEPEDLHDNNINFVRHFMGGLLGIDEHKLYSG